MSIRWFREIYKKGERSSSCHAQPSRRHTWTTLVYLPANERINEFTYLVILRQWRCVTLQHHAVLDNVQTNTQLRRVTSGNFPHHAWWQLTNENWICFIYLFLSAVDTADSVEGRQLSAAHVLHDLDAAVLGQPTTPTNPNSGSNASPGHLQLHGSHHLLQHQLHQQHMHHLQHPAHRGASPATGKRGSTLLQDLLSSQHPHAAAAAAAAGGHLLNPAFLSQHGLSHRAGAYGPKTGEFSFSAFYLKGITAHKKII